MKSRRLIETVGDGQPQPGGVRALGPDGLHGGVVEGPEGVEDVPGLLPLVGGGPQLLHIVCPKEGRKLVKADDPVLRLGVGLDVRGALGRLPGYHRHRGLGGVVAVLHAGGLGLLPPPP